MNGPRSSTPGTFNPSMRPSSASSLPVRQGASTSPLRPSPLLGRPPTVTSGAPPVFTSVPPTRNPQPAHRVPGYPFGSPAPTPRPSSSPSVFQSGIHHGGYRSRIASVSTANNGSARLVQGEWSFFGASLVLDDLKARAEKEASTAMSASASELGRRSTSSFGDKELYTASFGGDRWKLEVVQPSSGTNRNALYLFLDTAFSPIYHTSLFFGLRLPKEQIGKRDSKEGYLWSAWESEWCFGTETDYFECSNFPSFAELLQDPRIAEHDQVILSIQIQSPVDSPVPQLRDAVYIPETLFTGLANLVDDRSSGDVLFLVHERQPLPTSPSGSSGRDPLFRKRALYAHASILKARSTYFADMLTAGWAETSSGGEDRNVVKIEDMDFVTVYWMLSWLYTSQITFSEVEDIRLLPDVELPEGWLHSPHRLSWDWFDLTSLSSLEDATSTLHDIPETAELQGDEVPLPSSPPPISAKAAGKRSVPPTSPTSLKSRAPLSPDPPSPTHAMSSSSASHAGRISPLGGGRVQPSHRPPPLPTLDAGDPHPHPSVVSSPASALEVYKLAHRYGLQGLAQLALGHLVETLTPRTAFPLLLSTHLWPDLHCAIKNYALTHYFEVCQDPEFSRCYAEVGEGLWEHGGEVLLDFTLQLTPAWTQ